MNVSITNAPEPPYMCQLKVFEGDSAYINKAETNIIYHSSFIPCFLRRRHSVRHCRPRCADGLEEIILFWIGRVGARACALHSIYYNVKRGARDVDSCHSAFSDSSVLSDIQDGLESCIIKMVCSLVNGCYMNCMTTRYCIAALRYDLITLSVQDQ
jgi:hypothetical protein